MATFAKEEITKQSLKKLHEEQMLNGDNNKQNVSQIVEILGGIDLVLSTYLNHSHHIPITNDQLLRLNQILTTPLPYRQQIKSAQVSTIDRDKTNEETSTPHTYTFDVHNTVLNSICSETIAQNIKNIIHNISTALNVVSVVSILVWCMRWVLLLLFGYNITWLWIFDIYAITVACLWYPWLILSHTIMNKRAFILCLKSFDFWIKQIYGLIFSITVLSLVTQYGVTLTTVRCLVLSILLILLISYVGAFDAVNGSKRTKVTFSFFFAFMFWLIAIMYTFFDDYENDYKIPIKLTNSVLSMRSLLASSARILAIFFSKQAFNTIHKNGRAVSITYSPLIVWVDYESRLSEIINEEIEKDLEEKTQSLEQEEKEQIVINSGNVLQKKHPRISLSLSMHRIHNVLTGNDGNDNISI